MTMTKNQHDEIVDHGTIIVDKDHRFSIDITTRAITNEDNKKTALIQYDHNSERFSFEINREIEGHDLLLSDRVEIHYINYGGSARTKTLGLYQVTDLQVHPEDDTKVCFSWLISEQATQYNGSLSFLVSFECIKEEEGFDPEVVYRWNSAICNTIVIVPGINNNNAIVETFPDALLKWESYLVNSFDGLKAELLNTTLPEMVDQRYVERDFATTAEVKTLFGMTTT